MPNAVSALQGKVEVGQVTISEAGLRGMITLRGDLTQPKLRKVCKAITNVKFPEPGCANCDGLSGVAWMSPDEVLVMVAYSDVAGALDAIAKALLGTHHLAVNVSDARSLISVEGSFAREVIAKLAPADLHPDSFRAGQFRRTRLEQVAAAFWMRDDGSFDVICFRSVADYTFRLLATSAKAGPVGLF